MICNLFVFRHAETTDNSNHIFSGWRDPDLTPKGLLQAQEIAQQLEQEKIDYAFTSHLLRAKKTLEIVLKPHLNVPVFIDDRLIERCYGTLQGKSKIEIAAEKPEWFAKVHRGYDFAPPEGESMKMVESRTLPFVVQLERWLQQNPGNVAKTWRASYSAQTHVSIALSNRVLEKIDKDASKQKRSRSEFVELHFEAVFFAK